MNGKGIVCTLALTMMTPVFASLTQEMAPLFITYQNKASSVIDKSITSYVRTQLHCHKNLAKYKIDTTTHEGVVAFSGKINSETEACELIELAAAVPGVQEVDSSFLFINHRSKHFNDKALTAKVNGAFLREHLFGTSELTIVTIYVESKNGVVFLRGHAINHDQAKTAKKIAESVRGVEWVASSIKVE